MYIDSEMRSKAEGYLDALYMALTKTDSAVINALYEGARDMISTLGLECKLENGGHTLRERRK